LGRISKHTPPQFFIQPSMVVGNQIILTGDVLHHAHVQRLSPGEVFRAVVNDTIYEAEIEKTGPKKLLAKIIWSRRITVPLISIHLYPAILKGDKFDLVVEKTTELGVTSITPVVTNRTIVRLGREKAFSRKQRWQKIAKAASEQCGRPKVPEICDLTQFEDLMVSHIPGHLLLAHEPGEPSEDLGSARAGLEGSNEVSVLVGPEGGFDASEIEMALKKGFRPISLGPYILRAETASIAAVSLLMHLLAEKA